MARFRRTMLGIWALGYCAASTGCGQVADRESDASASAGDGSIENAGSTGGSRSFGGAAADAGKESGGSVGAAAHAGGGGAIAGSEPSCRVDWADGEAMDAPAPFQGLVGTYNGEAFAVSAAELFATFDCQALPDAPPPLSLSFTLASEGLSFVIRRCSSFVYLPDLTGIDLSTKADVKVTKTGGGLSAAIAVEGRVELHAEETATTPAIDLDFEVFTHFHGYAGLCPG